MKIKSVGNEEKDDWDPVEALSGACMVPKPKQPILVNIRDIVLGNCGREIDHYKVEQLQRSIADQGLRSPIQLYRAGHPHKGKFGLAAGQHQLQAAKNLGWQSIPAVVIKRKEAKAWRASENLHRSDLNELQKSLAIVEYAEGRRELPGVKTEVFRGGKQPHDKGYARLAAATGYNRKRIAEAYNHASFPKSVIKAILSHRKLNKCAKLNLIAEMKTEKGAVAVHSWAFVCPAQGKRPWDENCQAEAFGVGKKQTGSGSGRGGVKVRMERGAIPNQI